MNYRSETIRGLEHLIEKYVRDAAALAEGAPIHTLGCYIDGIHTPEKLASAIIECGALYLEKMKAIRAAAPVVRGETISVFEPVDVSPNCPSVEDERFLAACRKQLLEQGFVRAADADTYEQIAAKYPGKVHPERVRGSEARRYIELHKSDPVARAVKKRIAKGRTLR